MREDWVETTIDKLISPKGIFCDGDWVESKDQDKNGDIRLIQLADIGDGNFKNKSNRFLTSQKAEELKCTFLKQGDIIFARMPEPLGRAAIFPLDGIKRFVTVVDVAIIRPENSAVINKYLLFAINSPIIRKEIEALKTGTTRKRISRKNLSKILFPIAPLPIQRAIVTKIENLFASLDKGIADLKKAQEQLKVYRQAVLKKAFEGGFTNKSVKDGELPDGWKLIEISEIGEIVTGNTPSKKNLKYYSSKDYNFYKPTDLEAGDIVSKSNDGLSILGFKNGRQVPRNSILVTCIGATIGKTGLVIKEGCFNQQINAIIPYSNFSPKFIYYQAITDNFQTQIKTKASSTTLPILNKSKFSNIKMCVCKIEEQHEIVQKIESRLSVCDKIEQSITEGLQKSEALRQSILKKAFEGKLLSKAEIEKCKQEADYEPADLLLERIKREKKIHNGK
jgi:type I restriction enzyme S subunit